MHPLLFRCLFIISLYIFLFNIFISILTNTLLTISWIYLLLLGEARWNRGWRNPRHAHQKMHSNTWREINDLHSLRSARVFQVKNENMIVNVTCKLLQMSISFRAFLFLATLDHFNNCGNDWDWNFIKDIYFPQRSKGQFGGTLSLGEGTIMHSITSPHFLRFEAPNHGLLWNFTSHFADFWTYIPNSYN